MTHKAIIENYLEIMNYVLDYVEQKNIRTIEGLNNEHLVGDFLINIIGDFAMEIANLNRGEYDLNILNNYLDRLTNVLVLEDNTYEKN